MLFFSQVSLASQDLVRAQVEAVYSQDCRTSYVAAKRTAAVLIPGISTVSSTQCRCFICSNVKRNRISESASKDLWISEEILVPSNSRACPKHFVDGKFTAEAKEIIRTKAKQGVHMQPVDVGKWFKRLANESRGKIINVEDDKLTTEDFKLLFGISKENFEDMYATIKDHLRMSRHRSPRNCLAIFLAKLRLGVSQRFLAYLFGVQTQRKVSSIISRVATLLMKFFVPLHLRPSEEQRDQLIENNRVALVDQLFGVEKGSAVLLLDGTYIFIQKSKNHKFQRKTYSLHKHRNLLKAMMVVMPNGRILFADGLYFADYQNSDSEILEDMLSKQGGFSAFIKPGDHLIVDRGFQNVIKKLRRQHKLHAHMPTLAKKSGQKSKFQFSAKDANATRKVTCVRCVVEMVNGRIKNVFRFFDQVIPARYYVKNCQNKLGAFFQIACATLNAYFPPLFEDSPKHIKVLESAERQSNSNNTLQTDVHKRKLYREPGRWSSANEESVPNFPRLSEEDLFGITSGCYQINNAAEYTRDHLQLNGNYQFLVHVERDDLLRARIQSRYSKNATHDVWIEYSPSDKENRIVRYYCTCKVGARTFGCCSHIASILWYLGYRRHLSKQLECPVFGSDVLDASLAKEKRSDDLALDESETSDSGGSDDEDMVETEPEDLPSDDEYYVELFRAADGISALERSVDEIVDETECRGVGELGVEDTYPEEYVVAP